MSSVFDDNARGVEAAQYTRLMADAVEKTLYTAVHITSPAGYTGKEKAAIAGTVVAALVGKAAVALGGDDPDGLFEEIVTQARHLYPSLKDDAANLETVNGDGVEVRGSVAAA